MANKDERITAYILKSADFAKPVLEHFRKTVHSVCPKVEEKIKWGMPHFDYNGAPMCHMASFKQHCAIGFWKAALMKDSERLVGMAKSEEAMGHLGKITSLKDLPKDSVLKNYIKDAMKLNDAGIKLPARKKAVAKEIEVPDYFKKVLAENKKALQTFEAFSASHRKEYLQWITEAKTEETRIKRMVTAIEWLNEGKNRHWKYK
ncbi:MAG: YdeI/OmpD-associated family protein [Bacteroidia bacterium]|nr:YdeI/OmpD-associated family protein [Bacteroidia bacterium]